MRPGPIWLYAFYLLTVLLIISVIVYGLDLSMPNGTRKALTSQIKNSGQTDFFYKIDDKFAFYAFTDRGSEVGVTAYTRNYIPFCFVCGWSMGDPDDSRDLYAPVYMDGDLLYAERTDFASEDVPENVFPTYNMRTHEYGYVDDSLELGADPFNRNKKLTHKFVAKNFDELSYESADDEDCMISFGAVFLGYIILGVWWGIQALVWLIRRGIKRA